MAAEKERGGGGPGASKHLSKGLLQFFFLFPDETRDEKWRESHPRKEKKFFLGSFKAEAICRSYTSSTLPLLLVQDMAWRIWPGGGDLWSA